MENNNHTHNTQTINELFKTLSKKWTLVIIYEMFHHDMMRFKDFEKQLPDINSRTLTNRLKELEEDGFIIRDTSLKASKIINYKLSTKAKDLFDSFMALGMWAQKWDTTK